MLPDKYLRDLESSRRRQKMANSVFRATVFLAGIVFIGPFLHELAHVAWIESKGCIYSFSWELSPLTGLRGSVRPACYLSDLNLIVFYSIGYLSTAVAALGLRELGRKFEATSPEHLGAGMLVSILLSVTYEGDVANLMEVVGAPSLKLPLTALIAVGVAGTSYRFLEEAQKGRKASEAS